MKSYEETFLNVENPLLAKCFTSLGENDPFQLVTRKTDTEGWVYSILGRHLSTQHQSAVMWLELTVVGSRDVNQAGRIKCSSSGLWTGNERHPLSLWVVMDNGEGRIILLVTLFIF